VLVLEILGNLVCFCEHRLSRLRNHGSSPRRNQAALPRAEEECHPTVRSVRAGESVLGAQKTAASGASIAWERRLLITAEPPKQAKDRKTESQRLHWDG
jgi:hypothetical protein